jgi:hypothetical protein
LGALKAKELLGRPMKLRPKQLGSERESDGRPILGGFPESNEFGLRRRHTLNLE